MRERALKLGQDHHPRLPGRAVPRLPGDGMKAHGALLLVPQQQAPHSGQRLLQVVMLGEVRLLRAKETLK